MESTGSARAQASGEGGQSLVPGTYFDGFSGLLGLDGGVHQQTGLGHHMLFREEHNQGHSAPWGWETYTSYNMVGLFSAQSGRRTVRPFITTLACDPFYELLWLGWTNGFLSSFRFPHCGRYTSFPIGVPETQSTRSGGIGPSRDNVIHVGFPSASHIYTVSNSGVGVFSRGGVPVSCHSARVLTGEKPNPKILCGDSSRYPYYVGAAQMLGLGTRNGVTILDLQQFRHLRSIPYAGGISCIKSSATSNSFVVGGVNMLGIADPRLPRLGNTVQIHPTSQVSNGTFVSGLAVKDYTVAVITITICDRKIGSDELLSSVGGISGLSVLDLLRAHPTEVATSLEMITYKKNLDISNMNRDSVVRLFDIRKFRPRKNISFTPGPIDIAWGDNTLETLARTSANNSEDLYIIGNGGQWQVYHSHLDRMEFYAVPSVPLSTLNFSSSGSYLIIGDTSGSVHTMQRPYQGESASKLPEQRPQHPFSIYQTLSLPNLTLGPSARLGGTGCGSGASDGPAPLYNFSYLRSVQSLMGVASNPVTKPLSNGLGHPTAPNLTVALRYLQGRPVVAYDALNPVGIPPILEKSSQTGKIVVKDEELLSFNNRFDVEEIRRIQTFYGWARFKTTDELPCGVSFSKNSRAQGGTLGCETSASPSSSPPGSFSLEYFREIRPEIDSYKLRSFEFRTVDFVRVAPNPDPSKLKNNNLLYGLPLLSFGGNFPIWCFSRRITTTSSGAAGSGVAPLLGSAGASTGVLGGTTSVGVVSSVGSTPGVHQDSVSQRNPQLMQVPIRFQYKPKLNHSRRDKGKARRPDASSGPHHGEGTKLEDEGFNLPNSPLGDGQGIVSIELENDALDFTQPFFVLLSLIPRLSHEILLSHTPGCRSEFCLACELVHLTLMVQACRRNLCGKVRQRPVRSPQPPPSGSSFGAFSSNNASSAGATNHYQSSLFPYVSSGSVYILNMLRTIRHLPDAKQLGIDSDESSSSILAGIATGNFSLEEQFRAQLQLNQSPGMSGGMSRGVSLPYFVFNQIRKVEVFWKFFLENLKKSLRQTELVDSDTKIRQQSCYSALDSLFGVEVATISSCVQSKHTFRSTQTVAAIEIVSNHIVLQGSEGGAVGGCNPSVPSSSEESRSQKNGGCEDSRRTDKFLHALNMSLLRIVIGRSYCRDCGAPTACQHVRCVTRLPKILAVSCNVQNMKNWSDFGGMFPEECEDLARRSSHSPAGGGGGVNSGSCSVSGGNVSNSGSVPATTNTPGLYENPNSNYSIPWEIRFSRLRKGFGSSPGNSTYGSSPSLTSPMDPNGVDIIQVDRGGKAGTSTSSSNSQIYELIAVIFGVYQGSSIQLPSGTHFCVYVKQCLLFNEKSGVASSRDGKWFLVNGSSVQQVNKNEVLNFSTCWKIPVFLFYRDKDQRLDEFLFSGFPCIEFVPGYSVSTDFTNILGARSSVREGGTGEEGEIASDHVDVAGKSGRQVGGAEARNLDLIRKKDHDNKDGRNEFGPVKSIIREKEEEVDILGVRFRIPWRYPEEIQDHVIKQLTSVIQLIKTERNLSEHPDPDQTVGNSPFTPEEFSLLCYNYYVRYPFSKGLLKEVKPLSKREHQVNGSVTSAGAVSESDEDPISRKHLEFVRNSPMIVALDSEYVALTEEQSVMRADGTKEVLKKSQLSLARVSIVRCGSIPLLLQGKEREGRNARRAQTDGNSAMNRSDDWNNKVDLCSRKGLILDNYISHGSNNSHQPKDYLTKYSGVKPGDLDPKTSSHFLTSKACVLKKLQFLVDAGVVFIGHALQSDFKIINIYVPPFQIIDTVEIYRLPDERYISLRFLAKYVLNENIQAEVHDSIVDAKTAFELFLKYLSHKKNNTWNDFLNHLYSKGHSVDWKIDALFDVSSVEHQL